MNAKPKDAIAALRHYMADRVWPDMPAASLGRVLAWADSIPDGAVPVVWPADCTKQTLDGFADSMKANGHIGAANALRALAAIAPVRKKRVVNLWQHVAHNLPSTFSAGYDPNAATNTNSWRCVARNVELED